MSMSYEQPEAVPLKTVAEAAGLTLSDMLALAAKDHREVPSIFKANGAYFAWRDESNLWLSNLRRDRMRKKLRPPR